MKAKWLDEFYRDTSIPDSRREQVLATVGGPPTAARQRDSSRSTTPTRTCRQRWTRRAGHFSTSTSRALRAMLERGEHDDLAALKLLIADELENTVSLDINDLARRAGDSLSNDGYVQQHHRPEELSGRAGAQAP